MARVGLFFFVFLGSRNPPPRSHAPGRVFVLEELAKNLYIVANRKTASWTPGLRVRVLWVGSLSKEALARVWMGLNTPLALTVHCIARGAKATSRPRPSLGLRAPWENPESVSAVRCWEKHTEAMDDPALGRRVWAQLRRYRGSMCHTNEQFPVTEDGAKAKSQTISRLCVFTGHRMMT